MDDWGLFLLLAWLLAFATFGTWVIWRPGLGPKMLGVFCILLGIAPSVVVLVMLALS